MTIRRVTRSLAHFGAVLTLQVSQVAASETSPTAGAGPDLSPAARYCLNIADKAADARLALQTERLKQLEEKVTERIAVLEQRRDEVKAWVEKQEALLKAAEANLVEIYSKMDPEAAANQLASLDPGMAASVLHQLKPRDASGILDVMQTEKAALLVKILGAVSRDRDKDRKP